MSNADGRPNILFFYPDTLRHDWIGPRGLTPVRTPNVKRLADEGVDFPRAVTPSPLCAPARACLAAGKEYDRCRVPSNNVNYPLDQPTFYALLRDAGSHVMGCGKFDLHKPDLDWGLDGKRLLGEWGFSDGIDSEGKLDGVNAYSQNGGPMGPHLAYLEQQGLARAHVADYDRRSGDRTAVFPTPLPEEAYCDNWIGQNGLDLLAAAPEGQPWFLQVNFNGPHGPWDITERMEARWRGVEHPFPVNGEQHTVKEYDAIRQNYSAMVENIDRWVGIYLEELGKRGELDSTLTVFSSDHGDMLGDHNQWGKSKPLHGSVGAPLVIWGPGVRQGAIWDGPATALDVTATFLDYAGVSVPGDMDSRSLRDALEGRTEEHREYVLSGLADWRLVFDGRYKYIREGDGRTMLFDMDADPHEERSIIDAAPQEAARLAGMLDRESL
ncbi:MAG: sulfatase [Armatimonadota bacterium]